MAQDKTAEIISFNGGAPEKAPKVLSAPAPAETEQGSDASSAAPGDHPDVARVGETLGAARQASGQSLEDISDAIKVKVEHLRAIEAARPDLLPSLPYVVGFVKSYARYLGLDGDALAARYKEEAAAAPAAIIIPRPENTPPQGEERAKLASVFAVLVILLFALWVGFQVLAGGANETIAPTQSDSAEALAPTLAAPAEAAPPGLEAVESEPAIEDILAADDLAPAQPPAAETPSELAAVDMPPVETAVGVAPVDAPSVAPTDAIAAAPAEREPAAESQSRPLPRRPQPSLPEPVIASAQLTRSPAPDYPERCVRGAGEVESVTVMFEVSPTGRPVNSRIVSSSNNCFENEALRTLARWRFSPRTVDGAAAIERGKTATLNFRK